MSSLKHVLANVSRFLNGNRKVKDSMRWSVDKTFPNCHPSLNRIKSLRFQN
jgi:hypothetical protein